MSEKTGNYINLFAALCAAVLAVLVKTAAHPCQAFLECVVGTKVHMRCYYAGQAIFLISVLIVLLAVESFLRKKRSAVCYLAAMVVLILTMNQSAGIGICAAGMACAKMKTVTIVFSVLIGLSGVLQIFVKSSKEL